MASVTDPVRRPEPDPALHTYHPLATLRGTIRRYVALDGILTVGTFLVLWFWIAMLLDYGVFKALNWDWVQDAPRGLRSTALVAAVLALLAIVTLKVLLRLFREFSAASLALVLERKFPNVLGDRLITAVELSDLDEAARLGYSREMVENTRREARERVDQVPVHDVFDWRRMRRHGYFVLAITFGLVILTGVIYGAVYQTTDVEDFAYRFRDTGMILGERNVLLRNTPWPRRAHLELLDFPENGDLRIGREATAPKVRVQAYKWVIADSAAPEGWRPMTWADLPTVLGPGDRPLPWKYLAAADSTEDLPSDPAAWRLDRVERRKTDPSIRERVEANAGIDALLALDAAFDQLSVKTEVPGMRRTVRKLQVPETVTVFYWGKNTNNEMPLRAEADNIFAGALTDLKESVKFRVRGEDYTTATRSITLVPPPVITSMTRDEFRPAYLYHRPPIVMAGEDADARLRDMKQEAHGLGVSLSGGTSVIDLPAGTDVILTASADKELTWVRVLPRAGKYPGAGDDPKPIDLPLGPDNRTFQVRFDNVTTPVEFEFEFRDTDGVQNKRTVQVKPAEDKTPEVEVLIEILRKNQQGQYLCTALAMVPFGGKIRDDIGLRAVEYHFNYTRLESQAIVGLKASKAVGFLAGGPLPGDLASGVYPAAYLTYLNERTGGLESAALESTPKRVPVEGFATLYAEKGQRGDKTPALLEKALHEPPPGPYDISLIRQFDLKSKDEYFDLKKYLPELATDPGVVLQPRYRLRMDVSATDNNVLDAAKTLPGGKEPRQTMNKESFVLMVVSEAELLGEIAKEEEGLALKTEDAVTRLSDAKIKLDKLADQAASFANNDDILVAATRSQEIQDTILKCRDLAQEVFNDYSRILREEQTNRVSAKIVEKVQFGIVAPLDEALKQNFPRAEEAHDRMRTDLNETRKPSAEVVSAARKELNELIEKLKSVQEGMGDIANVQKLVRMIAEIEKVQAGDIGKQLKDIKDRMEEEETKSRISAAQIVIPANQKGKFTVTLKRGSEFAEALPLKFSVQLASELKLPVEVVIPEGKNRVDVDITVGTKTGVHLIKVIPTPSDPKVIIDPINVKLTVR
jgi:hypothetical protein